MWMDGVLILSKCTRILNFHQRNITNDGNRSYILRQTKIIKKQPQSKNKPQIFRAIAKIYLAFVILFEIMYNRLSITLIALKELAFRNGLSWTITRDQSDEDW